MLPNPRLNILMLLLACIGIFAIEMTSGSTTSLPSPLPSSSPSPIPSSPPSSLLSQPTGRPSKQDHSILGAAQRRSLKYLVVAKRERNLDGADEDLLRDEGIIASVSEVDDTPMTHVSLSFDFLFAGKRFKDIYINANGGIFFSPTPPCGAYFSAGEPCSLTSDQHLFNKYCECLICKTKWRNCFTNTF